MADILIAERDIHELATILYEDPRVSEGREMFYNELGLPPQEYEEYHRRFVDDTHKFLCHILEKWIEMRGDFATLGKLREILQGRLQSLAGKLETWTPTIISSNDIMLMCETVSWKALRTRGWLNPPPILQEYYSTTIQERKQDGKLLTDTIDEKLGRNSSIGISGPSGYGKTTLALSYADINFRKRKYTYMIWLECQNLSKLETCVKSVAQKLDIPITLDSPIYQNGGIVTEKSIGRLFEEIYDKLALKKCLFIFDNVENPQFIQQYLPGPNYVPNFHAIVDSDSRIYYIQNHIIVLDVFSKNEALLYLTDRLDVKQNNFKDMQLLKEFTQKLECIPVALQLLVQEPNVEQCLKKYSDILKNIEIPSKLLRELLPEYKYPDGLYVGLEIALSTATMDLAITSSLNDENKMTAAILMHLTAFLDQNDLPHKIFDEILNPVLVSHSLESLTTHKLLTKIHDVSSDTTCYQIHPVWRKVLKIRFQTLKKKDQTEILKNGMKMGTKAESSPEIGVDHVELRKELWNFIAIETETLFKSRELLLCCGTDKYFDTDFILNDISVYWKLGFVGMRKLIFIATYLHFCAYFLNFCAPFIVGLFLSFFNLALFDISRTGSLITVALIISLLMIASPPYFVIQLKISKRFLKTGFTVSAIGWVTTLLVWGITLILYENEFLKRLSQMFSGISVLILSVLLSHLIVNGFKIWLNRAIFTLGVANFMFGIILVSFGELEHVSFDSDINIIDCTNIVVCTALYLTLYFHVLCALRISQE